ncbi:response regulator transcription factor [Paenibacillus sp. 1P07SE]|uniref:response regulator transcription factor n=1 Tax=Paenibacillus sp. 1P07SE TaxID=3132209 RepID=UPI0039A63A9A
MWNLLVVEDEAIVRMGLKYMVDWESLGICWKAEASNGLEALDVIRQEDIHILMTDIRMPGMDGLELARTIKSFNEAIQVIFISSFEDFPYVKEAVKIGGVDYLHKPTMEKNEVEQALQKAILQLTKRKEHQHKPDMEAQLKESLLQLLTDTNAEALDGVLASPQLAWLQAGYQLAVLHYGEELDLSDQASRARYHSIYTFVENYIAEDWGGVLLNRGNEQLIWIMPSTSLSGKAANPGAYLEELNQQLKTMMNLPLHYAYSSTRDDGSLLRDAFEECLASGEIGSLQTGGVVRLAMRYVEEHLLEDVSLSKVAEAVHVSTGHLSRVFLKETGEHFSEYATRKKITHAKKLLRETNHKVYDIASELGYANPHYFSKLFKDEVGMTPLEFRNK